MLVIYQWKSYSGDLVQLVKIRNIFYIYKTYSTIDKLLGQIERFNNLKNFEFKLPKIIDIKKNIVIYEYIRGKILSEFLLNCNVKEILLIAELIFNNMVGIWDQSINKRNLTNEEYNIRLKNINNNKYLSQIYKKNFISNDLILNNVSLNTSDYYHGDFSFDNIIINDLNDVYLIDPTYLSFGGRTSDFSKILLDGLTLWGDRKLNRITNEYIINKSYFINHFIKLYKSKYHYDIYSIKSLILLSLLRISPYINTDETSEILNNIITNLNFERF
jgi:hypothetical protein